SPGMRLRIGSVTKQFTSFAYLLLCEDGLASIDDPLAKFLPDLHPVTHDITMRQLIGHTSGLRDAYDAFIRFNEPYARYADVALSVNSENLLNYYRTIDDREAPPDSTWIYNNGGYLLLSMVIERITGKSLEEVLRERVFDPIGMSDSLILRSDTDFISNRGSGHVINPAGGYEKMSWGLDSFLGAGAMVSTVNDLLRWLAHMEAPEVGSESTWKTMKT